MKSLNEMNVGVVGHIDHGKTTLLSRLTGKFSDTHSEELKRGITIKLGYTEVVLHDDKGKLNNSGNGKPVRYISFIDVPGHEMLMATMLSGATSFDAAILVIAANEGIKPQTKEHFMALQAKKIKNLIIAQNKVDLVSRERAIESQKEIREFLKGSVFESSPIIPVSAQQGVNVDKIFEELVKIEVPKREDDADPIFLVARSFDVNRPGKEIDKLNGGILGGILKKGKLAVGDEIEIKPGRLIVKNNQKQYQTVFTKINAIRKGQELVNEVFSGASIALETELDPVLTKTDSLNGCIVSKKGVLPEIASKVKIKVTLFEKMMQGNEEEKIPDLKIKEMVMLSVNTTISVGIVEKVGKDGTVDFSLNIPVVALTGDNVGLARNISGKWRLIGFGEIL